MSENLGHHAENEMNHPRHTSTLKKVVSVIEKENDIKVSQFLDQPEDTKLDHKFIAHSKQLHDDNICPLGIFAQQSRVDFAQKHLFRNGFKVQENEQIEEEEYGSQEEDSCFTAEDESLEEANLTDPTITNRDVSLDTNQFHNSDESNEILQAGGTNTHSYQIDSAQPPVPQNIDMFMACCDWEAAIEEEREQSQDETQLISNNNGNEGVRLKSSNITNYQHQKTCKRKVKMDFKNRNAQEVLKSKHDLPNSEEQEIDIDSMMKRTPPNEAQRRAQKRVLQRGKRRSPSKRRMIT